MKQLLMISALLLLVQVDLANASEPATAYRDTQPQILAMQPSEPRPATVRRIAAPARVAPQPGRAITQRSPDKSTRSECSYDNNGLVGCTCKGVLDCKDLISSGDCEGKEFWEDGNDASKGGCGAAE